MKRLYIVTLQLWEGRKATDFKRSFATVADSMEEAIAFVLEKWKVIDQPADEFRWLSSEAELLNYDLILPPNRATRFGGTLVSIAGDDE
jgi:hypothetical protein